MNGSKYVHIDKKTHLLHLFVSDLTFKVTDHFHESFFLFLKKMNYSKVVSDLRQTFGSGRTRDIEWRVNQLKSLYKFYDDNSDLFAEAIKKDLRETFY